MAYVGPGSPYINLDILTQSTSGIAWGQIPRNTSSPAENAAAIATICAQASADVDEFTQVPLRATVDTEVVYGPGDIRCQVRPSGVARIVLSRPPVTQIVSGGVCPAGVFPSAYNTIPANQFKIEIPLLGVYGTTAPSAGGDSGGQAILLAPGYLSWSAGRNGTELSVTYINGWPHGSLTASAAAGATSIHVDDVCAWLGANGTLFDPNYQETVSVTAVTPDVTGALAGPGTLTLAAGLAYAHAAGRIVTALPQAVIDAAVLYATNNALRRGATAITIAPGASSQPAPAQSKMERNEAAAEVKLIPFRRVW